MRLDTKDLEGVLAFVADAHDVDAPEPLTTELLDRLCKLVGCEYASYSEFDWPRQTVTACVLCSNEDPLAEGDRVPEDFWTADHSPRALHGNGREFDKLSDRFDRRERVRMREEDDWNAEFFILDRLGFRTGDERARSAWLHFDSQDRDFDERERELALSLRPHVEALWRRAVARRQAEELFAALERDGDSTVGHAIVLCPADRRIDHATAEARRLLAGWFGTRSGHLPLELDEWAALARVGDRYTKRKAAAVLTIEMTAGSMLTLRERLSGDKVLTQREREMLRYVGDGLTNAEIARMLWVAPSTVAKHLEQAYRKLGVHSRTAAVARLSTLTD